jgi:hypothetical protein
MIAGICARDKIANDGRTQLAMFTTGIFSMQAGGAIAIGDPVMAELKFKCQNINHHGN